eukprot:1700683-Rhodomonas_salina.2
MYWLTSDPIRHLTQMKALSSEGSAFPQSSHLRNSYASPATTKGCSLRCTASKVWYDRRVTVRDEQHSNGEGIHCFKPRVTCARIWILVTRCKLILGSLTHIQLWLRPDMLYPVNLIARHVSKASPILLGQLKWILRYLNKTKHYGLTMGVVDQLGHWPKLTVYVDGSDADCWVTHRSTGGNVVYYNGVPISWQSARQQLVTLSTAES